MLRLSTSSWSLHRALGRPPLTGPESIPGSETRAGELALLQLPARLAAAGIGTLEIVHFHFPSTDAGYLAELRSELDRSGIELFSILIDGGDITHPDPALRERHLAWIREWIRVAGQVGASHARVIAGDATVEQSSQDLTDHPAIRLSARNLTALSTYAREQGVQVITENFRTLAGRADRLLAILSLCGQSVGLCADFGNFKGDDKARELQAIFPFADSVHAKALYGPDLSPLASEFRTHLAALAASGFHGPISLIFDSPMASGTDEWHNLGVLQEIVVGELGIGNEG